MFDESEPADVETKPETKPDAADSKTSPEGSAEGAAADSKLKAGAENVTAAFRSAFGALNNRIGRNQANSQIMKAMKAAGIQKPTSKQIKAFRKALLGESLDAALDTAQTLKEEYHKYANPAELQAMDNLRVAVDKIVEQLVQDLAVAGYDDLDYYDSDCYMSGNNSCTITMFLGSEDTFEDGEAEELQDHMTNIVEEALAQIKLPPELIEIQGGAVFPDDLIMDDDDEANGITRGEITVDVTFARNLI
jgi:hypothetical protein